MAEDLVPIVQLYTTTFNYDTNEHETRLGMFSHKILILTVFGLNHFKQKGGFLFPASGATSHRLLQNWKFSLAFFLKKFDFGMDKNLLLQNQKNLSSKILWYDAPKLVRY